MPDKELKNKLKKFRLTNKISQVVKRVMCTSLQFFVVKIAGK